MFARCPRSSAAVTPDTYERDIIQVSFSSIFFFFFFFWGGGGGGGGGIWENNETEKICLVTPTSGVLVLA